ncbi:hypothetical protein KKH13_01080, partial [Patescibacteria group bacterium]|nr:hypothetical protein [Patescibacteria group bacterium]
LLGTDDKARAAVYSAVRYHNFPAPDSVTPEQYTGLLLASSEKEQLARSYILRHLQEGASFGLVPWETDVLATSCRVAGEFDMMCFDWRDQVQHNPLNQRAKELGLVNPYTVIKEGQRGPEEISYAEAFDPQVRSISDQLSELSKTLKYFAGDDESFEVARYLNAYTDALTSWDKDSLPELWRDVDRAWMATKGRLQIVASREDGYYDPNKIRVFPDFRLIYSNPESDLYPPIEATRAAMAKHLGNRFVDIEAYEESKDGMNRVQFYPEGYDIVFAGSLDFGIAGQSLPNEENVKITHGVKAFLNPEGIKERWELALKLVKKAFPRDAALFDQVDATMDGVILHVGGHEIGEPLLSTDSILEGLGADVFNMLNEDAATLAATITIPDRVKAGELPKEALETQVLELLGVYLRYINMARGVPHLEPYYKGMGLLGLRRMVDSKLIRFVDNELRIDLSACNRLYELSMRDFKRQVHIADNHDRNFALDYLEPIKTAEAIPEIAYLIKAVGQS